jgi:hypothetical protein
MVDHVESAPAFIGLGIGLPLIAVGLLLYYLRRRDVF